MALGGDFFEGILDLLDLTGEMVRPADKRSPEDPPASTGLDPASQELAVAIADQRGISIEAANEMVQWLRREHPEAFARTGPT